MTGPSGAKGLSLFVWENSKGPNDLGNLWSADFAGATFAAHSAGLVVQRVFGLHLTADMSALGQLADISPRSLNTLKLEPMNGLFACIWVFGASAADR